MYPDKLHIEPTKRTPWIMLEHGRIFIMGRSIIDNPSIFYESIHKWITEYIKDRQGKTRIELGFDFINSGSTKWLYILLRELSGLDNLSHHTAVTWYYEEGDEDMSDLGHIIKSLMECSFRIVKVDYMNDDLYKSILSRPL
ncbi:MAG: hypothetical protein A2Y71_06375 [Bacteroidetes bacterium RBG_13_42_15]|nr:MAG: hypothetical protein A2Y71_06375 [Bacteroidetes bacterium RBG_13_42_15]